MLLIAEIVLTVMAWKRGWKWLALLPLAIGLLLGVVIGYSIGINGGDINTAKGVAFTIDLLVIAALGIMSYKKKVVNTPVTPKENI